MTRRGGNNAQEGVGTVEELGLIRTAVPFLFPNGHATAEDDASVRPAILC